MSELAGVIRTLVVGTRHYEDKLQHGETTVLKRDAFNAYDCNAVCVRNAWGGVVGHLPRELAAGLAPLMDAGAIRVSHGKVLEHVGYNRFQIPIGVIFHCQAGSEFAIASAVHQGSFGWAGHRCSCAFVGTRSVGAAREIANRAPAAAPRIAAVAAAVVKKEAVAVKVKKDAVAVKVKEEAVAVKVKEEAATVKVKKEAATVKVKEEAAAVKVKEEAAEVKVKEECEPGPSGVALTPPMVNVKVEPGAVAGATPWGQRAAKRRLKAEVTALAPKGRGQKRRG